MDSTERLDNNGLGSTSGFESINDNDYGWTTVVYPKRHRKQKSVEQAANGTSGKPMSSEIAAAIEISKAEETKKRRPKKKKKKPKVTFSEAAAKIDASNLVAFLVEVSESYASQPEIQLMRFADYFGRALSGVSSPQFPWVNTFKESPLSKLIEIPLSQIPEDVYKTSTEWINEHSVDTLGVFVLWALDCVLADLSLQQGTKNGDNGAPNNSSSKSQVAIFVVLAMVLRRKPDALINVLPNLRENLKYQEQDKLPVMVWMMAQASQGDISVGLYSWAHNLLPIASSNSCNHQSRDLILQLAETILSNPKARTILVNGAVRKGERLIPPSSYEILVRLTFPAASSRVKATERFEEIYPLLKEVALADAHESKTMKQVTQQIFTFALKATGERNPMLAKEAAAISIWSLTRNVDCCKHWENLYEENLEASVAVLKKLVDEWKEHSLKLTPDDILTVNRTMKNLRQKNKEAITDGGANVASQTFYKDADKYCKMILGRLSRGGSSCLKGMALATAILASVGAAAAAVLASNAVATAEVKSVVESWDLYKLMEAVMAAFK